MEADGRGVLHQRLVFQLLAGQPTLVRTTIIELIAICLRMYRAHDGTEFRQRYFSDACQLVKHLLLLELQLLFVRQVLPLTSATHTKVLTERCRAYLTIINEAYHFALGKAVFLATNLNIAYIARHTKRYKHHQIVPVE